MLLLRQQRRRKLHGRGSKDFFSVFWKDSQCEMFSIIGCCQFHLGVQTTEERKEELLHEAFQVPPPPRLYPPSPSEEKTQVLPPHFFSIETQQRFYFAVQTKYVGGIPGGFFQSTNSICRCQNSKWLSAFFASSRSKLIYLTFFTFADDVLLLLPTFLTIKLYFLPGIEVSWTPCPV